MAANYPTNTVGDQRLRSTISQTQSRFSFAPPTPQQLQRSKFQATSPTNSDIEVSTMASSSPTLPPVSRSISMIAEQRILQEQRQGYRPQEQYQNTYHRQPQYVESPAGAQEVGLRQSRPRLHLKTPSNSHESDSKDPDTQVPPFYIHPPSEPYPAASLNASKEKPSATENTLFPAYKPQTPIYYSTPLSGHPSTPREHFSSPVNPESRSWSHSLCGISSTCCLAFTCPCIIYGRTQHRLNQKSADKSATDLLAYNTTNPSCILLAMGSCFSGLLAAFQRRGVRKLYEIEGSFGDDLLHGCCSCCCVLALDEEEILGRESKSMQTVQTGYLIGPGMHYPPPPRT